MKRIMFYLDWDIEIHKAKAVHLLSKAQGNVIDSLRKDKGSRRNAPS